MGVVKNLMVRAGADFSAITTQANKAKRSMSSMESGVTKSCKLMSTAAKGLTRTFATLGVGLSVTAIVSAAKNAKDAYDEQTEASAKLARVMGNTMAARSEEISSIEQLIEAQERLGVVTGDVQTEGAQELATYLTMSKTLETLIPVMNDMIAQQYGIGASAESAVSIATMLGKVMNGQTSALSRYGYTFDAAQEAILKYGTEAQRAAVLAEVVGESVGGMNAALAATPNGRLQQVSNTLGNIQEKFGGAVNSVLVLFIPAMNAACTVLDRLANGAERVAQTLVNVFGGSAASGAANYAASASGALETVEDSAVAAGEAVNALMGFDQIKKLTDTGSSGSSGSNTSAGAAIGSSVVAATVEVTEGESIGWLEKRLEGLKSKLDGIDGSKLASSLDRLKEAAAPLTEKFFSGIGWAVDNIFVPLATWTAESALPAFLDTLGGGASLLSEALGALKPLGIWLWDSFLQPVASWTGGVIVSVLGGLSTALYGVSDWISSHQGLVQGMAVTAAGFCAAWGIGSLAEFLVTAGSLPGVLAKVATGLAATTTAKLADKAAAIALCAEWVKLKVMAAVDLVKSLGSQALAWAGATAAKVANKVATIALTAAETAHTVASTAATVATTALGVAVNVLTSPITLVIGAVAALVAGIVLLVKNWDTVKETASRVWDGVKSIWGNVSTWFADHVTTPISNGFKGFANGIISFFEGLVNGGIKGVNKLIAAINKVSFDVPDWVPIIGGKTFGFGLPTVPEISLPRLAAGAVVSRPTRALIGEAGPEAVVPLKRNAEWLDALSSRLAVLVRGQQTAPMKLVIPVYVGGRKITEKVVDDINEIIRTTGECPIAI